MADLFRSLADNSGSVGTMTGNRPTGTADGDFLVAVVQHGTASVSITGVPTGWALLQDDPNPSDFSIWTYYKTASGEPASWDWTASVENDWRVTVVAFQNVHATTPLNTSFAEQAAAVNTLAVGAITTTADGCTIMTVGSLDAGGAARTWTSNGSPTERLDALLNGFHTAIYTEEQVSQGAITRSVTVTGTAQDIGGHIIAVAPAAAAAGQPTTKRFGGVRGMGGIGRAPMFGRRW